MHRNDTTPEQTPIGDCGYTLIEMLMVVVILGILTAAVGLSVSGLSAQAADTGCLTDRRHVHVAAEAYFAQRGVDLIPATGSGHDRYERTLVDGGFLHGVSVQHDLDATGAVTAEGNSSC